MLFPRAFIALTVAAVASAQSSNNAGPTSVSPAQASAISKDIVSYVSSLYGDPAFVSNVAIVATAIPSDALSSATDLAFFTQLATATPSWATALPTGVAQYYNSVAAAEASIVSKDLKGPAPTNAPAAALAAGVGAAAGLVALVL